MKKKIKLEAYQSVRHKQIIFYPEGVASQFLDVDRAPEFDIEKEIDDTQPRMKSNLYGQADEQRKPREFWLDTMQRGHILEERPELGHEKYFLHTIELLPGHIMVSREMLNQALSSLGYGHNEMLDELCRALGLGDV